MKKLLSIVLVVMMLCSCFAFAANADASGYGYQYNSGTGAYLYLPFSGSNVIWEFDLRPDADDAYISSLLGNSVTFSQRNHTLGVGSAVVSYNMNVGTFYHVKFDGTTPGQVEISVNGSTVSTIYATLNGVWCANVGNLTFDNLSCPTANFSENFDDQNFQQKGDSNGRIVEIAGATPGGPVNPNRPPVVDHDLGWMLRIDGYAHVFKDINRCDGWGTQNTGTVEFDMYMVPDSSGACEWSIFDSHEGWSRLYVSDSYAKTFWVPDEEESGSYYNWGATTLANKKHVIYDYNESRIILNIDGRGIQNSPYGTTPATNGLVIYVLNGSVFLDNVVFKNGNGQVMGSYDMSTNFDRDGGDLVYVGDCANTGHTVSNQWFSGLNPTCTETGYDTYYCLFCNQEGEHVTTAALGHNYGKYNDGRNNPNPSASADGTRKWTCKRCAAAFAQESVPKTSDYRGQLLAWDDFSDENVTKYVMGGFSNWEDAKATGDFEEDFEGDINTTVVDGNQVTWPTLLTYTCGNYRDFEGELPTRGFTVSFDMKPIETFAYGDEYNRAWYFWFGGESIISNMAGYDFDRGCFFVGPSFGTPYDEVTVDYALDMDKWYNFTFKFDSNTATGEAWCALYVDGQQVLLFDGEDANYELPYAANRASAPLIFRTFGVKAYITNWAMGDKDFEWINFRTPANGTPCEHEWDGGVVTLAPTATTEGIMTYTCIHCGKTRTESIDPVQIIPGDVNNDTRVSSKDSKLLKSYLVGDVEEDAINLLNADLNHDSMISSKDQKALKVMLTGGAN